MLSKKIICLILAATLFLSICNVFAVETTEKMPEIVSDVDIVNEDFEMTLAADIAVGMGALKDYVPTKEMNIGQMVEAIAVIEPSTSIIERYFGKEEYSIPVKRITALAVVLDILGYSIFFKDGSIDEEDITDIQSIAKKYNISNGVNTDVQGVITMKETAELILNTLEAKAVTPIYSSSGVETYLSNESYMERVLGMQMIDGIVQSTSYSSIIDEDGTQDGKIIISGVGYNCEIGQYENYIGMRVKALVKNGSSPMVLALHDNSEKYIEIAAKDLNHDGINKQEISYWSSNNKERKIALDDVVDVLYNYSLFKNYTAEDLKLGQGRLVLIDNDNDSAIDVVKIEEYRSMRVFSVSMDSETIADANGNSISITELIENEYPVFEAGKVILPNNIPLNTIATCFINKKNEAVRIYITDEVAAGTVNKFKKKDNTITLEGKDFVYDEGIKSKIEKVELGTLITVYLNYFGEIAHFEVTGENYLYGYLISFSEGKNLSNPQIKMFTQTNTVMIYDTKSKIIINGVRMDSKDAFAYNLTTGLWDEAGKISQIVKYKANKNGEIVSINTSTNIDPGDGSRLVKGKDDVLTYYSTPKSFGDDVRLNVNTKVFKIPTDLSFENKFSYGSYTILSSAVDYTAQIYDIDENYYAGVVVVRIDPYGADADIIDQINSAPYVILTTGQCIADSGDISVFVEARALGSTSNAPIMMVFNRKDVAHGSVTAEQLRPGDIIMGSSDYTNKKEYSRMLVWYQHGITEPFEAVKGVWEAVSTVKTFYSDGNTLAAGTIKQIIENGFVINHKPETTADYDNWNRVITTTGITPVSIVEDNGNRIYAASISDLSVGDKVFVYYRTGVPKEIVIYR